MTKLRRSAVSIELISPFPEVSLPAAWGWVKPALRLMADDFAIQNIGGLFEAAASIEAKGGKTWGVLRDGKLCGWLGFEPINKVAGFGHAFFAPWAWGRETTDAAVKLALAEIYAAGFEKVSCPVLAVNRGIRGLLRRIGMREEGRLRGHTLCGGKATDLVLYGELKAEFETYGDLSGDGRVTGRSEQHDGRADGVQHRGDVDQRQQHADVQPVAVGVAGEHGGSTPELHHEGAESHASTDGGDGEYQRDVQGHRRSPAAKPRVSRVRKLGRQRNGGTANGNRPRGSGGRFAKSAPASGDAAAVTSAGAGE